jgi:hypothetical protein
VGVGDEGQAEMRARLLRRIGGLARDRLPRFLLGRRPHAGFSASVLHNDFAVRLHLNSQKLERNHPDSTTFKMSKRGYVKDQSPPESMTFS